MRDGGDNARVVGLIMGAAGYGLFLSWMWVVCFSNFAVSHAGMNVVHATQLRITMLVTLAVALPVLGLCERFFVTKRGIAVSAALSVLLCPLASLAALLFPCACTEACASTCLCSGMVVQDVAWGLSGLGYAFLMVYWAWFLVALFAVEGRALVIAASMIVSSATFFLATLFLPTVSIAVHALMPLLSVALSMLSHRRLVTSVGEIAIKHAPPCEEDSARSAKLSKRTVVMTWFSGVALGFCGHTVTSSAYVAWGDVALSALLLLASLGLLVLVKKRSSLKYADVLWLYVPVVVFCFVPMCMVDGAPRVLLACLLIALLTAYSFVDLSALVDDMPRVAPHVTKTMAFGRLGNVIGMMVGWVVGSGALAASAWQPRAFEDACLVLVMVLVAASTYMFFAPAYGGAFAVVEQTADDRYEQQCEAFARRYNLTPRQLEVLRLLGRGRTALTIQEKLFVSESTAKSHIYNIYQKVGVHTQRELMDLLEKTEVER